MSLENTLAERGNTHGSFTDNAALSQAIKRVMRQAPNWGRLTEVQKEALEVISAKISRILSGNANEPDHWHDIQGYARLVEQVLTAPKRLGLTDEELALWKHTPGKIVPTDKHGNPIPGNFSDRDTFTASEKERDEFNETRHP